MKRYYVAWEGILFDSDHFCILLNETVERRNSMKKLPAFLMITVLLCFTACGKTPVQNIIEINASENTVAFREALYERYGYWGKSDDEIMARFEEEYLPYLNARTEQSFPEVETTNHLEKETYDSGDVYILSGEDQDRNVLFIHGGGWIWEISERHIDFCDKLVDSLGVKVYMPIYPLAPEADYAQTYQMIQQVYDELLKQNKPIIIMGDSAGGTITLGFVLSLKSKGIKLPEKVVVMAPAADLSFENSEIDDYQSRDGMLSRPELIECAKLWAKDADLSLPRISPLTGDYKGFPDTLMFVGDCDVLCADDLKLYDKMCNAGINATLVRGIGLWHVYPVFPISEQQQCLDIIADFCD